LKIIDVILVIQNAVSKIVGDRRNRKIYH